MAVPVLHQDVLGLSRIVGENLSLAKGAGLLADSDVGGGKTYITMKAAIATAAATKPAEFQGYVGRLQRAMDEGFDIGVLTDANVQAASTLAELIAYCDTNPAKVGGPITIE